MRNVVAYMQGGLGNQMFIYAAALCLARSTRANIYLRNDRFRYDGFGRSFLLPKLQCNTNIIPDREPLIDKAHNFYHTCIRKLGFSRFCNTVVERKNRAYQEMPHWWIGTLSLDGYWQSEKYFAGCEDEIGDAFMLRDMTWMDSDDIVKAIKGDPNPTFLHVRSYKDIKGHADGSYALPVSYYANALDKLAQVSHDGNVYLFSDDLSWAKERLGAEISKRGFNLIPVEDVKNGVVLACLREMTLMRLCKNAIIADSTYSWWGAWLAERAALREGRKSIVIRPFKGFKDDFYPDRWLSINV